MTRTFEAKPAKRERVPMLVGLVGPSGSGKTKSALRLATGMVKHTGGKIYFIDTEARRALHYADEHEFLHVQMDAPFSPDDYAAAIKHCIGEDPDCVLIIDSCSHEHEGPGGVLEMHDAELDRRAGTDEAKRRRLSIGCWAKPKKQRRELIDLVLRLGVNAIFCYRAKEKLKVLSGKDPLHLGWQPIGGEEFIYEMLVSCLLYPNTKGVPNWSPDEKAEQAMLKLPEKLAWVFKKGEQLSEETGERLAEWAAGEMPAGNFDAAFAALLEVNDWEGLRVFRENLLRRRWAGAELGKLDAGILLREVAISTITGDPGASGEDGGVCGMGPKGNECMQEPGHYGGCDDQPT